MATTSPAGELNDFVTSIESKIAAIQTGRVRSRLELEATHGEIKQLLDQYSQEIERARGLALIIGDEVNVEAHRHTYRRLIEELHRTVMAVRSNLRPKSTSAAGTDLFRRSNTPPSDPTASLAHDISNTLRALSGNLHDEVLRSESNFAILQRSSKRLQTTNEQYATLGGLMGISKRLIAGLWNRERTDRWLIMATLIFFYLVIVYILAQRLWVGRFIWPTVRLLSKGTWSLLGLICSPLFRLSTSPTFFNSTTTTTTTTLTTTTATATANFINNQAASSKLFVDQPNSMSTTLKQHQETTIDSIIDQFLKGSFKIEPHSSEITKLPTNNSINQTSLDSIVNPDYNKTGSHSTFNQPLNKTREEL